MMFNRLISFLCGRVELFAEEKYRDKLVGIITALGIEAKMTYDRENGGLKLITTPACAKKIARALDKTGAIVYINSVCGFANDLGKRRKRIGLLLGAILFFTILSLSTLFVLFVSFRENREKTKTKISLVITIGIFAF